MTTRLVVVNRGHEFEGVVREHESWAAAARRTCGSANAEPVPVDLSGEVKRFEIDHDRVVALRPMTRGDLTAVTRWRTQPHLRRWWTEAAEPTLESVTTAYGARVDGMSPTRMWVVEVNGRSIGFVQDYRTGDDPEFTQPVASPDTVGVDYAIGEPEWLGRGLGVRVLWAWMQRARRRFPDAPTYAAAPDHRNAASLRVLDKAGFVRGTWFDQPQADGAVATLVGCELDVARVLG